MAETSSEITMSTLSNYSVTDIAIWLSQNYKQVLISIESSMKDLLQDGTPASPSASNAFFAPEPLKTYFKDYSDGSQFKPVLNMIGFCATRFEGSSAHKLIFGEHLPIELFGAPLFFIESMRSLREGDFDIVLRILHPADRTEASTAEPHINNPAFVMRERFQELANQKHSFVNPLISSCTSRSYFSSTIRLAMKEEIPPLYRMNIRSFSTSPAAFFLCAASAAALKVSADYLLLPDYSQWAVCNGSALSRPEQSALSDFLSAPQALREEAVRKIWCLLADLN